MKKKLAFLTSMVLALTSTLCVLVGAVDTEPQNQIKISDTATWTTNSNGQALTLSSPNSNDMKFAANSTYSAQFNTPIDANNKMEIKYTVNSFNGDWICFELADTPSDPINAECNPNTLRLWWIKDSNTISLWRPDQELGHSTALEQIPYSGTEHTITLEKNATEDKFDFYFDGQKVDLYQDGYSDPKPSQFENGVFFSFKSYSGSTGASEITIDSINGIVYEPVKTDPIKISDAASWMTDSNGQALTLSSLSSNDMKFAANSTFSAKLNTPIDANNEMEIKYTVNSFNGDWICFELADTPSDPINAECNPNTLRLWWIKDSNTVSLWKPDQELGHGTALEQIPYSGTQHTIRLQKNATEDKFDFYFDGQKVDLYQDGYSDPKPSQFENGVFFSFKSYSGADAATEITIDSIKGVVYKPVNIDPLEITKETTWMIDSNNQKITLSSPNSNDMKFTANSTYSAKFNTALDTNSRMEIKYTVNSFNGDWICFELADTPSDPINAECNPNTLRLWWVKGSNTISLWRPDQELGHSTALEDITYSGTEHTITLEKNATEDKFDFYFDGKKVDLYQDGYSDPKPSQFENGVFFSFKSYSGADAATEITIDSIKGVEKKISYEKDDTVITEDYYDDPNSNDWMTLQYSNVTVKDGKYVITNTGIAAASFSVPLDLNKTIIIQYTVKVDDPSKYYWQSMGICTQTLFENQKYIDLDPVKGIKPWIDSNGSVLKISRNKDMNSGNYIVNTPLATDGKHTIILKVVDGKFVYSIDGIKYNLYPKGKEIELSPSDFKDNKAHLVFASDGFITTTIDNIVGIVDGAKPYYGQPDKDRDVESGQGPMDAGFGGNDSNNNEDDSVNNINTSDNANTSVNSYLYYIAIISFCAAISIIVSNYCKVRKRGKKN